MKYFTAESRSECLKAVQNVRSERPKSRSERPKTAVCPKSRSERRRKFAGRL